MSFVSLCNHINSISAPETPLYGDTSKFDQLKEQAINIISDMMLEMRFNLTDNDSNDLKNFKIIYAKAAELRHMIAIETGTEEAEVFGLRRTEEGDPYNTYLLTDQYRELNERIKQLVIDCLPQVYKKNKAVALTLENSRYIIRLENKDELNNKSIQLIEGFKQINPSNINENLNIPDVIQNLVFPAA